MKLNFAKKLALDKFLRRIDDVILRDEMLDLFKEIGYQGAATKENIEKVGVLLKRANIPYEDFEKLVKQFRR